MKVALVASEAVPFSKTGGLADIAGALPRALERHGHKVALFIPAHHTLTSSKQPITDTGVKLSIPVGARFVEAHVLESKLPNSQVTVYLISQPAYFDRPGLYGAKGVDYEDNCERFVFFSRAVLAAASALELTPDIIHCNDWQTGLIPAYLKTQPQRTPGLGGAGTLFTIHNMAYLGLFKHWEMALTGLEWRLFNWRQLEFHGMLCFLKAGLVFSDMISTVSPTYAQEIQTPRFGSGLDELLRLRQNDLRGIVNGIDLDAWSPAREPMLAANYDMTTAVSGKAACKAWLQRAVGLPERADVPLLAQIGRLDPQKGWDLVAGIADRLLACDVQFVVLGEGHPRYHELLLGLVERYPQKVAAHLGFFDALAHQIEAGADLFLMPSLFEPCGLNQLYSLAHGTVPIVRATGGLADTVVDATPQTVADGSATGFVFHEPTSDALWDAIARALEHYRDHERWRALVHSGMRGDWSWDRGARQYELLYQEILRRTAARASS